MPCHSMNTRARGQRCWCCRGRRWRCGCRLSTSQPHSPTDHLRLRRQCLFRFESMRCHSMNTRVHDLHCCRCRHYRRRRWRCGCRLPTSQPNSPTDHHRLRHQCHFRFVSMRCHSMNTRARGQRCWCCRGRRWRCGYRLPTSQLRFQSCRQRLRH